MSKNCPPPARQRAFTPIPPSTAITADTHLDRRGRPYIYLSINYGDQQLFLVPKRRTKLDPGGTYVVLRQSPLRAVRVKEMIATNE